jgi:hypothetical protein
MAELQLISKVLPTVACGKHAVLVVGYYRSGTSALSGALTEAGVYFKSDADANEHNPKGFFESTDLIRFDMALFDTLGIAWSDIAHLPVGWHNRADMSIQSRRLKEIIEGQFDGRPIVGLKHPHICKFLPLYIRAVEELGYRVHILHTHRDPFAIATSQFKKNGLSRTHALLLWASYMTEAVKNARGSQRSWIFYDDMIQDPATSLRNALSHTGLTLDSPFRIEFVTKSLRRSAAADQSDLFPAVSDLVQDLTRTIQSRVDDPSVWDSLSLRVNSFASFLAELGKTSNRVAPGVGAGASVGTTILNPAAAMANKGAGHPLRPAERTDEPEYTRVKQVLDAAGTTLPAIHVFVLVPAHANLAQLTVTLDSLMRGWLKPTGMTVLSVMAEGQRRLSIDHPTSEVTFRTSDDMNAALNQMMAATSDGILFPINAGDSVEPDGLARVALATLGQRPEIVIYSDEIITRADTPWIRVKPEMDIHRLREACFLGTALWYSSAAFRAVGGYRTGFLGSEDYDLLLRLAEFGACFVRVPEALFIEGLVGNRYENLPIETAMERAIVALNEHLVRSGVVARAEAGTFGGTFKLVYPVNTYEAHRISGTLVALDCDGATISHVVGLQNKFLNGMRPGDGLVHLVELTKADATMKKYLEDLSAQLTPKYPSIVVRDMEKGLDKRVQAVREAYPGSVVVYVSATRLESMNERDDLATFLSDAIAQMPETAILAPRTFIQQPDGSTRLIGPLLFGAATRIGQGRDGANPGPAGWLLTAQEVDAADSPMMVIHPDAPILAGETWSDLCASVWESSAERCRVVWYPHVSVRLSDDGKIDTPGLNPETTATLRIPYTGRAHHPGMTLTGDPLLLEGRQGLPAPGLEPDALNHGAIMSGAGVMVDGRAVNAARAARALGGAVIGWVPDPVDLPSLRRCAVQSRAWIRVNPNYNQHDPVHTEHIEQSCMSIWTQIPPATAQSDVLKSIIRTSKRHIATSDGIARALRGLGGRDVKTQYPQFTKSIWERMTFEDPAADRKPVVLWVDEGVQIDWLDQLMNATQDRVSWLALTERNRADLPDHVAQIRPPILEEGWFKTFVDHRPDILIRPSSGAPWMDDYIPILGLLGGCRVILGSECECGRIPKTMIQTISSRNSVQWEKAIGRNIAEQHVDRQTNLQTLLTSMTSIWFTAESIRWLADVSNPGGLSARVITKAGPGEKVA